MGLSVKLLGQFEVRGSSGAVLSLPTRKTRALLGYLALNADQPQPRERLMALLWSDRGDKQARQSLNHSLRAIRKLAEEQDITLLESDGESVMLRGAALDSDVAQFRQLSSNNPGEAADLYTGPFLDGLLVSDHSFEEWLRETQSQFHNQACDALQRAATSGDVDTRLDRLRRLLALDPLREEAHRQLMQLLHQSGDRTGALRQYQVCTDILMRELQVEPDATTKALFEEIHKDEGIAGPISLKPQDDPTLQNTPTAQNAASPQQIPVQTQNSHRWLMGIVAVILLFTVGGLTIWLIPQTDKAEQSQQEEILANTSNKPSIAVLPFTNMSGDEEQEYFADGMTNDLITDLSKVSGLTIISRTSTFAYKGKSEDIRAIAKALGVLYVVEGSIRKIGSKIRLTAQLVEAKSGKHLWAERYDRDFDDVLAVQDEVRGKIVSVLAIKLTSSEEKRLARHLTSSAKAYDLYLQGVRGESSFSKVGNIESITLFKQAIKLDPKFAAAYARLGQAYSYAVENNWTEDRNKYIKLALDSAKKGIELDNELPYAYWSLARIYTRSYASDLETATSLFEKSIELNPNYADGYIFLATTHIFTGHAEKALPLIEKGMSINPLSPFFYHQALGMARFFLGNYEAAVQSFDQALEQSPTASFMQRFLMACYGYLGQPDDADWAAMEYELSGKTATIKAMMETSSLRNPVYRKIFEEGLRKGGVPEE